MAKQKHTTQARGGAPIVVDMEGRAEGPNNDSHSAISQGLQQQANPQPLPGSQREGFWHTVKIDNRYIEVNYGTEAEFTRLLEECSLQAATDIRRPTDEKRKFFRCIHCGDTKFSNKMRLNKHRWDRLCPAVKDDTGNMARLLPYPYQGVGQGKVSEMIRKGKEVDVRSKVLRLKGADETQQQTQQARSTDVYLREGIVSKQMNTITAVPTNRAGTKHCNTALRRDGSPKEKSHAKGKEEGGRDVMQNKSPRDSRQETWAVHKRLDNHTQKERDRSTVDDDSESDFERDELKGLSGRSVDSGSDPNVKAMKLQLAEVPKAKLLVGKLQRTESERRTFLADSDSDFERDELKVQSRRAFDSDSDPNVKGMKVQSAPMPKAKLLVGAVRTSPRLRRHMVGRENRSSGGQPVLSPVQAHGLRQQTAQGNTPPSEQHQRVHVERTVTNPQLAQATGHVVPDPVWAKAATLNTKAAQDSFKKRKLMSNGEACQYRGDSPAEQDGEPAEWQKRTRVVLSPPTPQSPDAKVLLDLFAGANRKPPSPEDETQSMSSEAEVGREVDLALEKLNDNTGFDRMHGAETLDCNASTDVMLPDEVQKQHDSHAGAHQQQGQRSSVTPFRSGSPECHTDFPSSRRTPPETSALEILTWIPHVEGNHSVQRYWLCGEGTPFPKMYHPELASGTAGRVERLKQAEREVRTRARVRADAMASTRPKLKAPVHCEAPHLHALLRIWPQLLDWKYEGQTGEEFKLCFERSWASHKFEAAARECVMWWKCEAKEEDYQDVSKVVGGVVNSLCESVKYSKVPADIDRMARYLQYLYDLKVFTETKEKSRAELREEKEHLVQQAVQDWRHETRFKREAFTWDWCPIWWVVTKHPYILEKLPSLPWRHDGEESEDVRLRLLAERIPRVKPPHLLRVLRIAFQSVFGRWRLLSCPIFGINRETVRNLCHRERDLMLALAVFTFEASFRFAGLALFEADVVHSAVMKDAQLVCDGKEDRVMDSIMKWVLNVQVRALQDLARDFPTAFQSCWTTTMHEHWVDQSKQWMMCLRMREDLDMGWIAADNTPKWAFRVQAKRRQIVELIHSLDEDIEDDDTAVWDEYYRQNSKLGDVEPAGTLDARQVTGDPVLQQPADDRAPPSLSPVFGLSELRRSVQVDDVHTQDLAIHDLAFADNHAGMIGLLSPQTVVPEESIQVVEAIPRSLMKEFTHLQSASKQIDVQADEDSEGEEVHNTAALLADPGSAHRVTHRKSVTFAPPATDMDSKALSRLSIPQTYDYFKLDELMDAVPRKGAGKVDSGTINFYGGQWDTLPVPICQLKDLRRSKKFLGQNVLELLSRRLWWSLSADSRKRVYVTSSFMQGPLKKAWEIGTDEALLKWGRLYLAPSRLFSDYPSDVQVLVPYVNDLHWSLFIFTSTSVFHLDSASMHTGKEDREYVARLRKVWELLHNQQLSMSPNVEIVRTFRQKGLYECGYCILRFMELFLRLTYGEDPSFTSAKATDMFRAEVQMVQRVREMQKTVIIAVADELRDSDITSSYEPPYRVMHGDSPSSSSALVVSDVLDAERELRCAVTSQSTAGLVEKPQQ